MALSLAWKRAKLWSAVAHYRFGSHLRFPRILETKSPVSFFLTITTKSKLTTKAVVGYRTPKAAADFDI
jgi:hypothetical protein